MYKLSVWILYSTSNITDQESDAPAQIKQFCCWHYSSPDLVLRIIPAKCNTDCGCLGPRTAMSNGPRKGSGSDRAFRECVAPDNEFLTLCNFEFDPGTFYFAASSEARTTSVRSAAAVSRESVTKRIHSSCWRIRSPLLEDK